MTLGINLYFDAKSREDKNTSELCFKWEKMCKDADKAKRRKLLRKHWI